VAYDILGESLRLILDGPPDGPVRLSRRRRFAAVAVDVSEDVACTRFVRRGVGCFWDDTHHLARDGDGWKLLGGGSGSTGGPWSTDEFEQARYRLPAGCVTAPGHGATTRDSDRLLPWGARWVSSASLLAGPEVATIVVDGRRELTVPEHGHLVVVWGSRKPPRVVARDVGGRELTDLVLPKGR
jgi:hypothetical protein